MADELSDGQLLEAIRFAFPLPDHTDARLSRAARGALGQIWRLELDRASFAVKELFEAADESVVGQEAEYTQRLADNGVRVARSLLDRSGRFVSPIAGGWFRLSTWIEGGKVDLTDPFVPRRLGEVLARLHAFALPMANELGGDAPDPWYHQPPPVESWPPLVARCDGRWAAAMTDRLPVIRQLSAIPLPPKPDLALCHRDLHPENILTAEDGGFWVLDWDNLGPADPDRELAHILVDWFADSHGVAEAKVRAMMAAYRSAGGIARLKELSDFTMALAARLNFLHLQLGIALDPNAAQRDRDWAAREIDDALEMLPTIDTLEAVLAAADVR